MKFLIHTVPQRRDNFVLICETLRSQGAHPDDMLMYSDVAREGNLMAFVKSCEYLERRCIDPAEPVWHLQDDIQLSNHFIEDIKRIHAEHCMRIEWPIWCGFCSHESIDLKGKLLPDGECDPEHMWYSFPCIMIPVMITNMFVRWFYKSPKSDIEEKWIKENRYDDSLFRNFLIKSKIGVEVINIKPNLVDHRDDLCGGSILNRDRKAPARALYFEG